MADVDEGRKPGLSTDERTELVGLRRRNRVLETELEILKRASSVETKSAFFAAELDHPSRF